MAMYQFKRKMISKWMNPLVSKWMNPSILDMIINIPLGNECCNIHFQGEGELPANGAHMGNAEAAVNVGHVGLENEGAQGNDNSESDSSDGDSEEQNEQDVEVNSEDTAGSGSSDEGGDGDDLLYPGSTITLGDAMLAYLRFS